MIKMINVGNESTRKWNYITAHVLSIIVFRNSIELLLKNPNGLYIFSIDEFVNWWVHFPLFYITLWLGATLGFSILIKKTFYECSNITYKILPLIIVGPLVDLIIGKGGISYLYVKSPVLIGKVFTDLLNPFSDLLVLGIPLGPRVEVLLTIIIAGIIILRSSKGSLSIKLLFMAAGCFFLYSWIFFLCTWPALIAGVFGYNSIIKTGMYLYIQFYGLISFLITSYVFWISSSTNKMIVLSFLRPRRLANYTLLYVLGIFIYIKLNNNITVGAYSMVNIALSALCGFAALTSAFISTTILNDFTDRTEDDFNCKSFISLNPRLISYLKKIALICCFFSSLLGLACSSSAFCVVLLWFSLNYIYSFPPLRLKQYFLFSYLIIAIASILTVIYGIVIFNDFYFRSIPNEIILIVFIVSFLGAFIKDLPDTFGDSKAKIFTLPVIMPIDKFKWIYIILLSSCYIIAFLVISQKSVVSILLFVPLLASIISFWKQPQNNTVLFLSYYASITLFITIYMK